MTNQSSAALTAARIAAEAQANDLAYVHERIDQLIRQSAIEVAALRQNTARDVVSAHSTHLTLNRFWAADDAAAETCGRRPRDRGSRR